MEAKLPFLMAWACVLAIAGNGRSETTPTNSDTEVEITDNQNACAYRGVECRKGWARGRQHADDRTGVDKAREFFAPETARPDPVKQKYEEFFGEPYPPPLSPDYYPPGPFAEVRQFDDAFDRVTAGAQTRIQSGNGTVTVSVLVPDSEPKHLHVAINNDRILLSLSSNVPPAPYRVNRRQNISVPKPAGIDPATALVDRRGDLIAISFMAQETQGPNKRPWP